MVNWRLGRCIVRCDGRKPFSTVILAAGLIFNLGLLINYKYLDFLSLSLFNVKNWLGYSVSLTQSNGMLPLGISFYSFMAISYLIDLYRENKKHVLNINEFSLYFAFFPHLIAGPIVRYQEMYVNMPPARFELSNFCEGTKRFIIGFGKKILIADTLGGVVNKVIEIPTINLTYDVAWLGAVCFTLQIYFDFSGYTDMAIGLARMFGFVFPENFNYPYVAQSVREFWRRWHMTLSRWFRDYLYIPLGGSQKGDFRTYLNLMIVFGLCGIWHGASWNFVFWGFYYGFFLVLERMGLDSILRIIWRPLRHVYTMMVVTIGWVFFRIEDMSKAINFVQAMAGVSPLHDSRIFSVGMFMTSETMLVLLIATLGCVPLKSIIKRGMTYRSLFSIRLVRALRLTAYITLLLLSSIFMASSTYNPFIYSRF